MTSDSTVQEREGGVNPPGEDKMTVDSEAATLDPIESRTITVVDQYNT